MFWPYLRDEDEMPSWDKQVFTCIAKRVNGNISQPMSPIGIGKRPRESAKSFESCEVNEKVENLSKKANNLKYVVGLFYNMLNAKELVVSVEEIKIPTRPDESSEEDREETRKDIHYSPVVDPQGASLSATVMGVR